MWLVFQATTTVAAPLQAALDAFFTGPVSTPPTAVLDAVGLGGTWVQGLVVDGLIAGVGMLLTFVPLMAVMFAFLSLLEDSGYLARAAVVTDRVMRAIGLPGRAFLPLVVGFGCNVPAISGTRVLPDARHRLLTALLVPFTSCSARLTVYVLVATTFFGDNAGTVVFAMYVVSIVLVVLVGLLLRAHPAAHDGRRPAGARPAALPAAAAAPRRRRHLAPAARVPAHGQRHHRRHGRGRVGAERHPGAGRDRVVRRRAGAGQRLRDASPARSRPVFDPAGLRRAGRPTSALMVGFVAKEAVISSWAQTYATAEPRLADEPGVARRRAAASSFDGVLRRPPDPRGARVPGVPARLHARASRRSPRSGARSGCAGPSPASAMQLVVAWILAVAVFQVGSRVFMTRRPTGAARHARRRARRVPRRRGVHRRPRRRHRARPRPRRGRARPARGASVSSTRSAVSVGCPEGGCGGCPAPTGQGCATPGTPRRGGS